MESWDTVKEDTKKIQADYIESLDFFDKISYRIRFVSAIEERKAIASSLILDLVHWLFAIIGCFYFFIRTS